MQHAVVWLAAIVAWAVAPSALGHEIVLEFPDFQLAGGQSVSFDVEVDDPFDLGVVDFIYFTGFFQNAGEDGSWASDLQLSIEAPSGAHFAIGGFDHLGDADASWEFQGPGSEPAGLYTSFIFDPFVPAPFPDGIWTFTFTIDRLTAEMHLWSDVAVWLIPNAVPAPPAAGLLAIGLLAPRRRRASVTSSGARHRQRNRRTGASSR